MDFFKHQAAARGQTRGLLWLFVLAFVAVIAAMDAALFSMFWMLETGEPFVSPVEYAAYRPGIALVCTAVLVSVLGLASLYKTLELRGGGGVAARALGGVRIERDTKDLKRKRLHNVVEEMAIASGVPMPEIYVLEQEAAINAFAAGLTPANAAVAVTQGALDRLNREQLQGVIAHEFSHILNGDMRLNVQLMGWLFGLFVIFAIGRLILRLAPETRRGAVPLLIAASIVVAAGYIGMFVGRLLQAAVSRQRERLADASAVQFTRDTHGLKDALLKIAGLPAGSKLVTPQAEQVAHMLFSSGVKRLFSTHPSLLERIQALDPQFREANFSRLATEAIQVVPSFDDEASGNAIVSQLAPNTPEQISAQVGNPETVHIQEAYAMRLAIPENLREFVESTGQARALVLALLMSRNETVRQHQLTMLTHTPLATDMDAIQQALPLTRKLTPMLRLPTLLQLFPALRRSSKFERQQLMRVVNDLINADANIDVFEFCLARLLSMLLRDDLESRPPHGKLTLEDASNDLFVLFATLARFGANGDRDARMAYEVGMQTVLPMRRPAYDTVEDWPQRLGKALARLETLHPFAKKAVIEGLVRTIAHDELLNVNEAELLRAVCALLHCPLPPLLPSLGDDLTSSEAQRA